MNTRDLFLSLRGASTLSEALVAVEQFVSGDSEANWVPVGNRENNRGTIEVSGDPGRALIERVTNGVDAVLESEHAAHGGSPDCRTPREAATAWLNVPPNGLSHMTQQERRLLAARVTVTLLPGDTKEARILEVRDLGIGLTQSEMPKTILSLNESNKLQKHYLAGIYGQGGSSTFLSSKLTLIASRSASSSEIAFSVVKYQDLPPELFRTGHYVYLVSGGNVLTTALDGFDFPVGTLVRHFGYDLSGYSSPVGPSSVYGLLNQTLFDPIMPVWLDSRVHNYRRVIKGSRNALNGAVDEGDETSGGPALSHRMPMLYVPVGEYGRIGVEYWVLEPAKKAGTRPNQAFVNPARPILLTLNGHAQAELSAALLRKDAGLPYLAPRIICHIACDSLSPPGLRQLFVSNRETARSGNLLQTIRKELIDALRSDDDLVRLNNEARNATIQERDETALLEARKAVAKLLRLQGLDVPEAAVAAGTEAAPDATADANRVAKPRGPRKQPEPIELHEPPTYIRILWEKDAPITFHAEQRRYIRIETDAESSYHDAANPHASRINFIVSDGEIVLRASSPLQGGRLRAVFDCPQGSSIGGKGTIRVEMSRPGLNALADEREFVVVKPPPPQPVESKVSLPPFDCRPVAYGSDAWQSLDWPDDVNAVASAGVEEDGVHVVYYSEDFPPFKSRFDAFERRSVDLAKSFTSHYSIWLIVHSLIYQHSQAKQAQADAEAADERSEERIAEHERSERVRVATISAMVASKEAQQPDVDLAAEGDGG